MSSREIVELEIPLQERKKYHSRLSCLDPKTYRQHEVDMFQQTTTTIKGYLHHHFTNELNELTQIEEDKKPKNDLVLGYNEAQEAIRKRFCKLLRIRDKPASEMQYLNVKGLTLHKFIEYYENFIEIIQNKLAQIGLELNFDESAVLYDCLMHAKGFPSFEREQTIKSDQGFSIPSNSNLTIAILLESQTGIEEEKEEVCRSSLREVINEKNNYKKLVSQLDAIFEEIQEMSSNIYADENRVQMKVLVKYLKGECRISYLKFHYCFPTTFPEILHNNPDSKAIEVSKDILTLLNQKSSRRKPLTLRFLDIVHSARVLPDARDIFKPSFFDNRNFEKFFAHLKRRTTDEPNRRLNLLISENSRVIHAKLIEDRKESWKQELHENDSEHLYLQNYTFRDVHLRNCTVYGTPGETTDPYFLFMMVIFSGCSQLIHSYYFFIALRWNWTGSSLKKKLSSLAT